MSAPIIHFRYCPRCGNELVAPVASNRIQCGQCGFRYYFNPTVSAAAIVRNDQGEVLLLRRSKEPAMGKLSLPGGFVDFEETAEAAVQRETREEVGIELGEIRFLCSETNQYHYQDVTYPVVDLFFVARAKTTNAQPLDGAESICWLTPQQVHLDGLSFPSVRKAWQLFLNQPR